ncbi:unnamed protein product [Prunus armeniaca]|uniref:UvrD-like helicase ATP-binding domain-containing protein n=1 Tax=Prunus armeniaca TaxID=36596 RepID=A0A6J5Y392_PRUAR|nr:unnamed protein product [Prunus armeniaca]
MMEGSESLTDILFSWSLQDILNENLYQHKVEKIPESFQSVQDHFGSYSYPLLDETRTQLRSSMETMDRAPYSKIISVEELNPYGTKLYDIKVDCWRNLSTDCSKGPYKILPGDVFVLADTRPETVSDLQKLGSSWALLVVTEVSKNKNEDDRTALHFKVKASKEFEVNHSIHTSLFMVFLLNIAPYIRIWKAMHMSGSATWKVVFSDNFLKSFKELKSFQLKMSVLSLLLRISSGWRPRRQNVEIVCRSSSMILRKFKVEGLYILSTTDIVKNSRYVQVLKIWDILPDLQGIEKLVDRLDSIFKRYTDGFINLCRERCLEGDVEVPASWPPSLDVPRFKDVSIKEIPNDFVGHSSGNTSYVERCKVRDSLLLMKFYSLSSSGVMNVLLSDHEGRELDLPFEVTDQEMETILYNRSTFILGRSGTGKTTVLTMKLYQKEQKHHRAAEEGFYGVGSNTFRHVSPNNEAEQISSSSSTNVTALRQLFVTVSPKLCFSVKQHISRLKSFACGGSPSGQCSLIDMDDFDDEEAQFRGIPDSFLNIPPKCYPLCLTFRKFLMMLDGSLGNSYFERFLDITELPQNRLQSSRSVLLQNFLSTKEVNYERFSSSYWPRFNIQLTKKLDASRVFTEIISQIKGGLGAMEACDGKLSRQEYAQMSEGKASDLDKEKRDIIYDIFQVYEKMKRRNGEFDIADFVNDIHRRFKHEKYEGDDIDFVYIDEVQDLAMSQIALFKYICSNVEEGFVFSGDTAQTIARGIHFRFQDIRHLFYNKFVLDSRRKKHKEQMDNEKISEIFHLTENFRSHDGILKLLQSIVELLYHFFPHSIDKLKPETIPVYGEAPILIYSGENENVFETIFGNSVFVTGNTIGFGAEQVILVRDASAWKEVSNSIRKQALVLTIMDCKGLEFQDVLLYKFFGSSPLKNQWRVIYDFMKEQDSLNPALPERFPSFDDAKHSMLCHELKQLYVAVSRTRQRLWIYENVEELSNPMFDYWKKKCLVQVRQLDDSFAHSMQVASSPQEWKARGIKLYQDHNYKMARMCFEKAGDTFWKRLSEAAELKAKAHHMRTSNPEMANTMLRRAALIFEAIGLSVSAARCFYNLGEYKRAGYIYLDKCKEPELERAGECFSLAGCYALAADAYARGNYFSECISMCSKGKLFDRGLEYIKDWKQHATAEYGKRGNGTTKTELDFLEICAFHYSVVKDERSRMETVRDEMFSAQKTLNGLLSSSTSKFLWEDKLMDNRKQQSEGKKYKTQVSADSLLYFWNSWKDKSIYLIEYLRNFESIDADEYRNYEDFFLNYLGVWRLFHEDLNPIYLSVISDVDWIRGVEKRIFRSNGELVSIDVHKYVSAAQNYWSSEMLYLGIKVLGKLEALYRFLSTQSHSKFFRSKSLIQIYEVVTYLLNSKFLKRSLIDRDTLQKFVKLSGDNFVSYIFPLDWRKSSRENMISLRRSDACKNLLKQVIVEYMSSSKDLSSGKIGYLASIILASGKLNDELCATLVKNIEYNPLWKAFIENLCGNIQEPRVESLLSTFGDAMFKTYNETRSARYYISPSCFLYLVDRLLIWVSLCQGYVITERSCFIEWLIYHEKDTRFNSCKVFDVQMSFEVIRQFLTDVIRECLFDEATMIEWIGNFTTYSNKYYSLLMQRLVMTLCLLYLNFGIGFDILLDLMNWEYVTENLLPREISAALRRIISVQKSLGINVNVLPLKENVNVLAKAFKKTGSALVIATSGIDCSRFVCSDALFVDMKGNLGMVDILRHLFPEQ